MPTPRGAGDGLTAAGHSGSRRAFGLVAGGGDPGANGAPEGLRCRPGLRARRDTFRALVRQPQRAGLQGSAGLTAAGGNGRPFGCSGGGDPGAGSSPPRLHAVPGPFASRKVGRGVPTKPRTRHGTRPGPAARSGESPPLGATPLSRGEPGPPDTPCVSIRSLAAVALRRTACFGQDEQDGGACLVL